MLVTQHTNEQQQSNSPYQASVFIVGNQQTYPPNPVNVASYSSTYYPTGPANINNNASYPPNPVYNASYSPTNYTSFPPPNYASVYPQAPVNQVIEIKPYETSY